MSVTVTGSRVSSSCCWQVSVYVYPSNSGQAWGCYSDSAKLAHGDVTPLKSLGLPVKKGKGGTFYMHVYDHEQYCLTNMVHPGYCSGGYGILVDDGEHYKIQFHKDLKKWSLAKEESGQKWKLFQKWTAPKH